MAKFIHGASRKMTQLCRKVVHVNIRWRVLERVSFIRQFFRFIWDRIIVCSLGKTTQYRRLSSRGSFALPPEAVEAGLGLDEQASTACSDQNDLDSDLVALKISLLGDCQIGKTSFLVSRFSVQWLASWNFSFKTWFSPPITWFILLKIKYVGDEQEKRNLEMAGLNLMDKTLSVQGARISLEIWDVGGMLINFTNLVWFCFWWLYCLIL